MNISDLIWEWASQNEKKLILSIYSFGESLESLSLAPEDQIRVVDGECPFIEAWYGWRSEVLKFREELNNRSISSFYNNELLVALDDLSASFDDLIEEECVEASEEIFYMNGWGAIRNKSKLPLKLIEWRQLKECKHDIIKIL